MTEYVVWCPAWRQSKEEGRRIDADSPRAACEKWAEWEDAESADYLILQGSDVTLMVAELCGSAKERTYIVTGESVPVYYGRLLVTPNFGVDPHLADRKDCDDERI